MHKFGICRLGATILQRLEVEHPAAKVLVELAELQDSEVGDGTTSVVIIAAELLKRGTELVKNGIHPTTIMSGFRLALKEAVKFVKSNLMVPIEQLGDDALISAAKTSMASKLLNADESFWSKLAVDAVRSVKTCAPCINGFMLEVTYELAGKPLTARHGILSPPFISSRRTENPPQSLNL
jgi:chaperonin GroEL (HSP60 family)|tara:strand:- start:2038 stop:2580 length:543 start_codon:yes stop_codon:yes gene_type:complete|mmetsp:Transcript_4373/g.14911  ORF Transcript_4373/g.14911 Transcript_4373/m.14911 type:complete len:181 (-) Transcript_4373:1277-1819(-)